MGSTQSKATSEPIIFYNQNVPLQGFVESLESRRKSSAGGTSNEDVEEIVRQRVAEELKRLQEQESQREYGELAKANIDKDYNSVAMGTDIQTMIDRIKRNAPKEIPADIAEHQEAVVACYKKNSSRPLDCWEEVEQFKESVAKAQKKFVAAHQ